MFRVIFLSRSDKDVSRAEDFGDITYLLPRTPNPFSVQDAISNIREALDSVEFDPANDFVAMTGPPDRLAVMFGVIVEEFGERPLKILIFDASTGSYKPRIYDVSA